MADNTVYRELQFSSVPENINLIESLVQEIKRDFALNDEMEANMLVAITEAVNNAIFHGNKLNPMKQVNVIVKRESQSLQVTVDDEGTGFDSSQVKDPTAPENLDKPTGRGIFLMRNLADKVDFQQGGKRVTLSFLC